MILPGASALSHPGKPADCLGRDTGALARALPRSLPDPAGGAQPVAHKDWSPGLAAHRAATRQEQTLVEVAAVAAQAAFGAAVGAVVGFADLALAPGPQGRAPSSRGERL